MLPSNKSQHAEYTATSTWICGTGPQGEFIDELIGIFSGLIMLLLIVVVVTIKRRSSQPALTETTTSVPLMHV